MKRDFVFEDDFFYSTGFYINPKNTFQSHLNYKEDYKRKFLGDVFSLFHYFRDIRWHSDKLDLSADSRGLSSLPDPLRHFTHLKIMDLMSNKITKLPTWISCFKNLQELHLKNNRLTSIPKEIGALVCLEKLDLSFNFLTEIPKELKNLDNLKYLYLQDNKLQSIPKEIAALKNLQRLYIFSNKQLKSLPQEIKNLPLTVLYSKL